jgi:hypothetical protein
VHIPIEGMHLLKSVWGEDAHEFKWVFLLRILYNIPNFTINSPDRWDNLPAKAKASPGLYANLMSFSVGPNVSPQFINTHSWIISNN